MLRKQTLRNGSGAAQTNRKALFSPNGPGHKDDKSPCCSTFPPQFEPFFRPAGQNSRLSFKTARAASLAETRARRMHPWRGFSILSSEACRITKRSGTASSRLGRKTGTPVFCPPFSRMPNRIKNPRADFSGGDFITSFPASDVIRTPCAGKSLQKRHQAAAASLLLCRAFRISRNTTRSAPLTSRQIQGLELTKPATR